MSTETKQITYHCAGCTTEMVKPYGLYIEFLHMSKTERYLNNIPDDVLLPEKSEMALCQGCNLDIKYKIQRELRNIQKKLNRRREELGIIEKKND